MQPDPAHILIVDDDEGSRDMLAELLRGDGYRVSTAVDGYTGVMIAKRDAPDLVISDVRMPHGDGFQLVRALRAISSCTHIPVVLMSALSSPDRRAAGLDLGADDFITKPVDFNELRARVRAQLRRVVERQTLEHRAVVDPLTGVLNRRGISTVLHREEQRSRRSGSPLSVLMVDVDRFKAINDQLGHQAGDTVLRHVANGLSDAVRLVDHVGRWGGDEFLVVLPDTDSVAAHALAARLRSVRLPAVAVNGGDSLLVTVSIGEATLTDDDTIDRLVGRADAAMYRVKRTVEIQAVPS